MWSRRATQYNVQNECTGTHVRMYARTHTAVLVEGIGSTSTPARYVYFFINFLLDAITAFCCTILYCLSNHSEQNMELNGWEKSTPGAAAATECVCSKKWWLNERTKRTFLRFMFSTESEGLNKCSNDKNVSVLSVNNERVSLYSHKYTQRVWTLNDLMFVTMEWQNAKKNMKIYQKNTTNCKQYLLLIVFYHLKKHTAELSTFDCDVPFIFAHLPGTFFNRVIVMEQTVRVFKSTFTFFYWNC